MISAQTSLVGLLGDPVNHSLSPIMHNAALREMNLDWCYLALPCKKESLYTVLEALRNLNCQGINITIPHKKIVTTMCNELSHLAKKLGAVNTLVRNKKNGWTCKLENRNRTRN